jgi:hypothetical protein
VSRNVSRPQPEQRRFPIHFNADAPPCHVCDDFDTACGVSSCWLDRHVSSNWSDVTCQRCLRTKRRRERFARRLSPEASKARSVDSVPLVNDVESKSERLTP